MLLPINVQSETGRLRSVIIGYPDSFEMPDPINRKHEIYHESHPQRPRRQNLIPEFTRFRAALEERGVEVFQPRPVPGVPDQLTPRDIGFVVGDVFVVASMATDCRKEEWRGIAHVLDRIPPERIIHAPADVVLEGGDVILDKGALFVGLSERTTADGAAWLADRFADRYEVIPVPLKQLHHGEDVLHMDCAFLPVGARHALIYPEGFHEIPDAIGQRYELIMVDKDEQFELSTNVLSISPTEVLARDVGGRVNEEMRRAGLEVIEIAFDDTPKSGGSVRCASLPLWREHEQAAG